MSFYNVPRLKNKGLKNTDVGFRVKWRTPASWQRPGASVTFLTSSLFSVCSVLPLTFRLASSMSGRWPGPFFLFSLARMDDSLSGNGGISSKTVACVDRDYGTRHQGETIRYKVTTVANTNSSIPTLSGQYSLVYCTLLMSTNINELVVTMWVIPLI